MRRGGLIPTLIIVALLLLLALAIALEARSEQRQGPDVGPAATAASTPSPEPTPAAIERVVIGRGSRGAVILQQGRSRAPRPTVIFWHGWGLRSIGDYGGWLRHLVHEGNRVIFPRYQPPSLNPPAKAFERGLAGIRAALREAPAAPGTLVVAGHSAGGALAVDYAAAAARRGLPRPVGLFVLFPGRAIRGFPEGIPAVGGAPIPSSTELLVLAGNRDTVVGAAPAQAVLDGAVRVRRKQLVTLRARGVSDHYAPTRSSRRIRRAIWARLDRLIERSRR